MKTDIFSDLSLTEIDKALHEELGLEGELLPYTAYMNYAWMALGVYQKKNPHMRLSLIGGDQDESRRAYPSDEEALNWFDIFGLGFGTWRVELFGSTHPNPTDRDIKRYSCVSDSEAVALSIAILCALRNKTSSIFNQQTRMINPPVYRVDSTLPTKEQRMATIIEENKNRLSEFDDFDDYDASHDPDDDLVTQ